MRLLLAAAMLLLLAGGAPSAGARTLVVLGDSYSSGASWPFPTWAERLGRGDLQNLARNGATALDGANSLATQLGRYRGPYGPDDVTVVYLGHNDVGHDENLDRAAADLDDGLAALRARGADAGARRLVLVVPHDWGRSPVLVKNGKSAQYRARSLTWRRLVLAAAKRHGATVADVFGYFEMVFANPRAYGLADIRHPSRNKDTALYYDSVHVGARGQELLARAIGPSLGR